MTNATRYPAEVSFTLAFNGKITLLTLLVLPLLITLGSWQLQRAEQKRALLSAFNLQQSQAPVSISDYSLVQINAIKEHSPVSVEGQFDQHHSWLLDNKIRHGKIGYEVITPFKLNSGAVVLVNRGWLAGTGRREQLPGIPDVSGVRTIFASVIHPSVNQFLKSDVENDTWPLLTVQLDHEQAARALNNSLPDMRLRLVDSSPAALVTEWQPINISAQKHVGYSVQWFAMAFALIIWFIFASSNLGVVIKGWRGNRDQ